MLKFSSLNIGPEILKAIEELGYSEPTPIQAATLPLLLEGPTDFLGLAATGTGKTAAYSIPLLERIDPKRREIQGLVLCPTRELAIQVAGQIDLLGKFKGIRALPIYGGAGYGDQIQGLKRGIPVVVGTPGRLIDHIEKGTLSLRGLKVIVLDEADEMISMGFKEELETILGNSVRNSGGSSDRNTWLFSATMSPEVKKVAATYLKEPKQVQINRTEMLSQTVDQIYYATQESNKPEVLCKLIEAADQFYGLVFFQTKSLVIDATQYLKSRGYRVESLHGDMDQGARDRMMKAFRERHINILLCTDVASRGIDVQDISHVINYSIPRELDVYVHRIGRTARSGKSGIAMSLVTPSHRGLIGKIENFTKSKMREGKIPTRKEIGERKVSNILATFQAQAHSEKAVALLGPEWKEALGALQPQEIAGRFLTMMYPEIFAERPQAETVRSMNIPARNAVAPIAPVRNIPIPRPVSKPGPQSSWSAKRSRPPGREDRGKRSAAPWQGKSEGLPRREIRGKRPVPHWQRKSDGPPRKRREF